MYFITLQYSPVDFFSPALFRFWVSILRLMNLNTWENWATIQLIVWEFTPLFFLNWWNKSMGEPHNIWKYFLLECRSVASTLVSFIVQSLEIGAWLKSTCVLNVQNCVCHLMDGISRGCAHWKRDGGEHEGIRTKYLSAPFIFNVWRIEWANNHQPSHAIIFTYLYVKWVRRWMPTRSPEICLAQMQTLKLPFTHYRFLLKMEACASSHTHTHANTPHWARPE